MDKKSNHYSRQGSGKTLQSSEQSRKSDVSKQLPRNARRRENPNQVYTKQDPARTVKNQSAKNRPNVDKRPKPRGFGNSSNGSSATTFNLFASGPGLAMDGAASIGDDGVTNNDLLEVELNSIYLPGSRKQNLNHLLNFHYASRDFTHGNAGTLDVMNGTRNNNRGGVIRRQKYNKEQFLQANFQFVLKSEDNIHHNIASPDTLVDWNLIEQINIQAIEEPQCPICLYPPVAAKLTRCGHAYCWPCILHYLALSDKTWRKCPICYESVHIGDLKSTTIIQHHDWKVGDTITMHLMRRLRGSMFIEEVGGDSGKLESIPHLRDNNDTKKFTKFLLADPSEVQTIIAREKKELLAADEVDTPESVFVKQALNLLEEREKSIVVKKTESVGSECGESLNSEIINEADEASEQLEIMTLEDQASLCSSDISEEPSKPTNDEGKYHYFYQSRDGQNIYLHSLNVKILQAMYGSLDKCPCVIEAKIIEKHIYSMNEDLRKKLRYLQHLPLTCQFEVVELQLEPPIILPEVVDMFKDEIIMRQKARMRRAREERKRERQINEINDRQMGKMIARSANIDINSSQQFPSCGYDDFPLNNSIGDFPQSLGSDLSSSPPTNKATPNTSFAKMLSSPKREFWPTLGFSSGGENTSTVGAWGKPNQVSTTTKTPAVTGRPATRILESDSLEELYDEHFRQSLGEVIVEAIQQKKTSGEINKDVGSAKSTPSGNSGGKKGKKNKKMLLFSTGMNHKGN